MAPSVWLDVLFTVDVIFSKWDVSRVNKMDNMFMDGSVFEQRLCGELLKSIHIPQKIYFNGVF